MSDRILMRHIKRRTKSEVLRQRNTVQGCCDRHADNMGCTCLEEAVDDKNVLSEHPLQESSEWKGLPLCPVEKSAEAEQLKRCHLAMSYTIGYLNAMKKSSHDADELEHVITRLEAALQQQ